MSSSIQRAMERQRKRVGPRDVALEQVESAEPAAAADPSAPRRPHEIEARRDNWDVELDLPALRARGMLTPDADHRELQEQYRLVKRRVISQAFPARAPGDNPPNLIQVTSSVAEEGKTFTAFNLGMSIAMEVDFTVLLIDADLTRRSLTHLVGLDAEYGMTDVLTGSVRDVRSIVYRTNIPRLSVVPAGQDHPRSTELVASDAMRRLTRELATRYSDRLVIFDSTPLLMDSQAATLAGHMGQALVVVEAGRTQEQVIREAVGLLDTSNKQVGMLLNKGSRSFGYGYGYYGGY